MFQSQTVNSVNAEPKEMEKKIMHEYIAGIFNEISENGSFPTEIKHGILIPLQKVGKEKGKLENIRPVILLNLIRKILAIVMLKRIFDRIDREIPTSQTAYRPGRSTTENVFALKISIEKALCMTNYEINVILLDISKAFDNVDRNILLSDLRNVLGEDEVFVLKILIEGVT